MSVTLEQNFNPETQLLSYVSVAGDAQISFQDIQSFINSNIQVSIIYGCRIGCGGLMCLALWLITKNKRTVIFMLNQASLVLLVIHSLLYFGYLFGPFNGVTQYFTGFDMSTRAARQLSVAIDVIFVLLVICIQTSLVFQVRIIFRSPEMYKLGLVLTLVAALIALATVGSYLMAMIESILLLYQNKPLGKILNNLPIILFAASTIFTCVILMIKLAMAIRSRRYLGLKQFGTLHILLIMTTQTMIVPMVLTILSFGYMASLYSRLTPIAIMFITLQLPLSSMWASSANNSSEPSSSGSSSYQSTINSSDIERLETDDEDLKTENNYVMFSARKYRGETHITSLADSPEEIGFGSYPIDLEDKLLWEEANRLTASHYEEAGVDSSRV